MAPSAISPQDGRNGNMEDAPENHTNGNANESRIEIPSPTKFYTDAYTHGYTEGYIFGNGQPRQMPIAIVGMSCRLPGNVNTPDEFWELLSRARSGWSEIPKERFDNASFHHPNPGKGGCFNAIGGNFLKEDLGLFDAPFFSLTAQEATSMDPQQRLLLECTFEALDSAGIPKHKIVGKEMGVFMGGSFSEYEAQSFTDTDTIPMYQSTGCAFAMQSNRISHFFDLRGPSFTMDTACSSSLVALHQACLSLRNGESKSAIVGGCHLNMLPEFWISMGKSRLFSDQGRSFSFDSRGTGYGRGEGCGIVVLKPLDQALKDNDIIRSVIVASGVNQDGKTPGITMPNGSAQESLMKSVYKSAGLNPKDTGYVEAHGTGTKVGDPIEAAALHNVFGEDRSVRNPLFIGSVKSNIGHLEAASGIIAVIKTAMMLERGFILPNYDFKKPNEKIPFAKWGLKVPISQRPWPRPKRFASVNNFGFGGTNAHCVLERAPYLPGAEPDANESGAQSRKLFVLSANDKNALEAIMKNIGIYLEQRPEIFQNDLMSNIAYTLGQRRSLMQWRIAIPTDSSFELIQVLNSGKIAPVRKSEAPRIGFIFTGQGAQCARMGWELYEQYPVYASTIDACEKYLTSVEAPFSLISELQKDARESLINEAHVSQPACTAIQLAITDLLKSWGISPTAVTGHSSGEIGAAYAAGFLTLDACMAISYHRGMATISLRKKFPELKGAMMAVGCTKEEIAPFISQLGNPKGLRIACYNSPTSLTISGDGPAIDELGALLEAKQIFNRKLAVDVAYHSHHMKLVADEYHDALKSLEAAKTTDVKFYSSLFGHLVGSGKVDSSYWVQNLTQSVRFSEALTTMCEPIEGHRTGVNLLIEIGPHSALAGPVKQILKSCGPNAMKIPYTSSLVRKKDAVETALDLASILFIKGATLDLGAINLTKKQPALLVDMPRYPWNHQTRYWHEPRMSTKHKNRSTPRNDLLGTIANYSNDLEPTWRNILRIDDLPWLRHHKIQGLTLFPMSGFVAMAVEAAAQRAISRNVQYDDFELRNVVVNTPLMITDEDVEMTLQLRPHQEGTLMSSDLWDEFRIHSWAKNKGWTEHCKGLVAVKCRDDLDTLLESSISEISKSATTTVDGAKMYSALSDLGVSYGISFQGMKNCQTSDNCSTATITTVDTASDMPQGFQTSSIIHPALLEQLVEMYWPILGAGPKSIDTVYLPSSIGNLTISRKVTDLTKTPGNTLQAFCKGSFPSLHPKPVQVSLFATAPNDTKEALITMEDLTVSPILEGNSAIEAEVHRELCYKLEWEPILEEPKSSQANGVLESTANGAHKLMNGITNGAANGHTASDFPTSPILIIHSEDNTQSEMTSKLSQIIETATGTRPETGTLSSVDASGKICILLSELNQPLLSTLTSAQFTSLQKVLTTVSGVLWVVRGAYLNSTNPEANMITGLSRSIRSETLLKFATLDLDAESPLSSEETIKSILDVFKAVFRPKAKENCELEYSERKGKFFTPRIVNDEEMNELVHKQTQSSALEPTKFIQDERALKMVLGTPGALDSLHFVDQEFEKELAEDEVEIVVKAIGVNHRDLAAEMEQLDNYDMGAECSGVVTKVGATVSGFAVGDRVAGISVSEGAYSTYARLKARFAFKVSEKMSFEQAASIPVAYSTTHYGLLDLGRLEKDEKVLINGAHTAAGQAAIGLAQMVEAGIFATVDTTEQKEFLAKSYNLSESHVFLSPTSATHHRKFDIVLSCSISTPDTIRQLWSSLSNFGRFIELEKGTNPSLPMGGNKSFISVDVFSLADERPKVMSRLISNISQQFSAENVKPIASIKVVPISAMEETFKILQHGEVEGKIVVSPQEIDEVKAIPSKSPPPILQSKATYLLVGGTGGLGRSIARWMVSKGAKNIVLISRSGSATGKVKELMDDLKTVGNNIIVKKCDVSDKAALERLVREELKDLPEIKGVVHGAMVLDDVLFEKMTFSQYTHTITSKLHGASNLHSLFSTPTSPSLDFFIALSSAAGAVGNRGQAAYAAANTYLNALIQQRRSLNVPGISTSLDLTAVSDAGYLAENAEAAAEVSRNLGSDTICEAEVLALIGASIEGKLSAGCNGHVITGMRIPPTTTGTAPPFWSTDPKFLSLLPAPSSPTTSLTLTPNQLLRRATTPLEAQTIICNALLQKLPEVLLIEKGDMDKDRGLSQYALDSLVAIEVRNWVTREFEAGLQVLELLSCGSVWGLAGVVGGKSGVCRGLFEKEA